MVVKPGAPYRSVVSHLVPRSRVAPVPEVDPPELRARLKRRHGRRDAPQGSNGWRLRELGHPRGLLPGAPRLPGRRRRAASASGRRVSRTAPRRCSTASGESALPWVALAPRAEPVLRAQGGGHGRERKATDIGSGSLRRRGCQALSLGRDVAPMAIAGSIFQSTKITELIGWDTEHPSHRRPPLSEIFLGASPLCPADHISSPCDSLESSSRSSPS